jgi:predicted ABC-type ATPase
VIESTLSAASLALSIAKARERGYEVTLVFVFLDSTELCLRRLTDAWRTERPELIKTALRLLGR